MTREKCKRNVRGKQCGGVRGIRKISQFERSREMLQNEPTRAVKSVGTAEKGPNRKVPGKAAEIGSKYATL